MEMILEKKETEKENINAHSFPITPHHLGWWQLLRDSSVQTETSTMSHQSQGRYNNKTKHSSYNELRQRISHS